MKDCARCLPSEPLPLSRLISSCKAHQPLAPFFFCLLCISSFLHSASALVQFRGDSFSFTFLDAPARFAIPIDGSGVCGALHVADPVDACKPLRNANSRGPGMNRAGVLLIARGTCSFDKKVRNAQDAGYEASIVYDDQDKSSLLSMMGNSEGISIHAVFVSKMAGETLGKLARGQGGECCISSSTEETAGTVLVISFVSLVVIVSVLATFFFARNCRPLRHGANNHQQSINRQAVEVLPSFTFRATFPSDKKMSETCAICLEDYKDGETLRVLPCMHEFHTACVDSWLTKWGTFCPVCKHEMRSGQ